MYSKFPPHKMTTLHLSYDPKTQGGLVLRLRARLGHHFQLRFHAIGVNGRKRKRRTKKKTQPDLNPKDKKRQKVVKEDPFPIQLLPAELVDFITTLIIKLNPSKAEAKGLFSFARSSPFIRNFFESEGLEGAMSLKTLGAIHSRSREERRLGLESNVAGRYRGVLNLLGLSSRRVSVLQDVANRNALIHKARGSEAYDPFIVYDPLRKEKPEKEELEEEEQPEIDITTLHISAWPWWYFRLLSNYKSMVSMSHSLTINNSDGFFASVVTLHAKHRQDSWMSFEHNDSEDVRQGYDFLTLLADNPERDNYKWQKWSAGADLMVIPMGALILRAKKYFIDSGLIATQPIVLSVHASEPMPRRLTTTTTQDKAAYRKEVVVLTKEMPKQFMVQDIQNFAPNVSSDLHLTFDISQAYLGDSLAHFLESLRTPKSYMHMKELTLEKLYFENPSSLDLAGKFLSYLIFGSSNMKQVPNFCPAPELTHIDLQTGKNDILIWDIPDDPATCLPKLHTLYLSHQIQMGNSPEALNRFSKFPSLSYLILDHFYGNVTDLRRLAAILAQAPQAKLYADKNRPGIFPAGITVEIGFGALLFKYLALYREFNATFKGLRFESRD